MVELWKGKQCRLECTFYRGLLVADSLAKAFIGSVYQDVQQHVVDAARVSQFGGVEGGGTDLAGHSLRAFLQATTSLNVSTFVLYVDLERAFDGILRELLFGWLGDPTLQATSFESKVRHLSIYQPWALMV